MGAKETSSAQDFLRVPKVLSFVTSPFLIFELSMWCVNKHREIYPLSGIGALLLSKRSHTQRTQRGSRSLGREGTNTQP